MGTPRLVLPSFLFIAIIKGDGMFRIVDGKVIKIISYVEVSSEDVKANIASVQANIDKLKEYNNGKKIGEQKQIANEERRIEVYKQTLAEIEELESQIK